MNKNKDTDATPLMTFTGAEDVVYMSPKKVVLGVLNENNERVAVKLLTRLASKIRRTDYKLLDEMVELATTEIEAHCPQKVVDEWFKLLGKYWEMKRS